MNLKLFTLAAVLAATAGQAQTVVIDSLEGNGTLTATVPSNAVYSIEWKGALDGPGDWTDSWYQHRDVQSSNGTIEVEVPMAFRLTCWTNGVFLQAPIGRTYHYSVSNAVGQVWRQEIEVVGDAKMPGVDESYRIVRITEFYDNADEVPWGAQTRTVRFIRSEESSSYHYDLQYNNDVLELQDGPNGTSWSYYSSDFDWTNEVEIISHGDVTVSTTNGPVTYTDCVEFYTQGLSNGFNWQTNFPVRTFREWVKPGEYLVKRENSLLGAGLEFAAPVVYELQGWTEE